MNRWFLVYLVLFIVISVWIDVSVFATKKVFTILAEDPITPVIVKNAIEQRIVLEKVIGFQLPDDKEKNQPVPTNIINGNKETQLCIIS